MRRGLVVGDLTWRDAAAAWPQPIVTNRESVADPESLGMILDSGGGLEALLVLWTGGWADLEHRSTARLFSMRPSSLMWHRAWPSLMGSSRGCSIGRGQAERLRRVVVLLAARRFAPARFASVRLTSVGCALIKSAPTAGLGPCWTLGGRPHPRVASVARGMPAEVNLTRIGLKKSNVPLVRRRTWSRTRLGNHGLRSAELSHVRPARRFAFG